MGMANKEYQFLIQLKNIGKAFSNGKYSLSVLDNLNFCFEKGDMVAITGRSGSGKTTLLNILAGMISPDTGEYLFKDDELSLNCEKRMRAFRNSEIGYLPQHSTLLNDRSVEDNILLPSIYSKKKQKVMKERVLQLACALGFEDKLAMRPAVLSGGEQQRVALARAMIMEPNILLADEPTGSLDEKSEEKMLDILQKVNRAGLSIIIITHNQGVSQRCKLSYVLNDGQLIENPYFDHILKNATPNNPKQIR